MVSERKGYCGEPDLEATDTFYIEQSRHKNRENEEFCDVGQSFSQLSFTIDSK